MIRAFTHTQPTNLPRHYRATDGSELHLHADGTAIFRVPGGMWQRVALGTLADLAASAVGGYDSAAEARAVAETAAAMTLAGLRHG